MNALRPLPRPHSRHRHGAGGAGRAAGAVRPIPSPLLDFLILANFSFAFLILLLTFYMARPVEFSTFPSLLLIATLVPAVAERRGHAPDPVDAMPAA
jgi:hypothetical protein